MNPAQHLLVLALRIYRWVVSPLKAAVLGPGAKCRFVPSCSEYALEAVRAHGAWRGSGLALRRLCRCHPWGGWGWDPAPPAGPNRSLEPPRDVAGEVDLPPSNPQPGSLPGGRV